MPAIMDLWPLKDVFAQNSIIEKRINEVFYVKPIRQLLSKNLPYDIYMIWINCVMYCGDNIWFGKKRSFRLEPNFLYIELIKF